MIGRTLGFVACVFAFVAVVVPRDGDEQPADQAAPEKRGPTKGAASSDWFAGDHTLNRQSNGHFYASASVDGVPVRMMIDTGASMIALTGSDARAIGLHWDDAEVRAIGRGASGNVYGVPIRLSEVEIGGMVRSNVDAVIVPSGLDVSLLGQSYLSQIGAVEINGDTMVMSND